MFLRSALTTLTHRWEHQVQKQGGDSSRLANLPFYSLCLAPPDHVHAVPRLSALLQL